MIRPKVLKGFRDSLPSAEAPKIRAMETLTRAFAEYGFVPIDTPILEYTEVLLGKGGGETDKQIYRFEDNGGRDVAMRFDLTVPFARFVAAHENELAFPFKRYHMAKVWRGENAQRGRYREFIQCDFDIVGTDSPLADLEVLLLILRAFDALGIPGVTIRVSHRGNFNRFLAEAGYSDQGVGVLRAVDKYGKIGEDGVRSMLGDLGVDPDPVLRYAAKESDFDATIAKMETMAGGAGDDTTRLREIWSELEELGLQDRVVLDPTITRGLDYYTGIVFETYLNDLPDIGAVCSGGRYDNLAGLYTKSHIPGVGAAIGLDRLMAALEELGHVEASAGSARAIVFNIDPELTGTYIRTAQQLRAAGIATELAYETKKMNQMFKLAERKGIPFAVIIGSDEKAAGTYTVKNLRTRENSAGLSLDAMTELIRQGP